MRRLGLLVLVAACLALAPPAGAASKIERVVSPGGIEAWYVREPSIPILTLDYTFRDGGATRDPAGQEGLAEFHMSLLDDGAGEHDALAFKQRLEELGVEMSFGAGRDRASGSLRTLSERRHEAFGLLGLALAKPRFDAAAIEETRGRILAAIRREGEDVRGTATRAWFAKAFDGHAYARTTRGTAESVAKIGAAELRARHSAALGRDRLIVGAVGDVEPAELGRLLDLAFGALPAKAAPAPAIKDAEPKARGVQVIRKSVPQAWAVFGLPGLKRDDPDYYAAYLMNYTLGGGGFVSRLYREVREERGLAYSVASYLALSDRAGLIMGSVGTANARFGESLGLIRAAVARMRDEGPSDQELADAKTYVTGSFPLGLDSNAKIAGVLVGIQAEKLGVDFLEKRNAHFERVSREDIMRVARRLLDPAKLFVVVVGDPADLPGG